MKGVKIEKRKIKVNLGFDLMGIIEVVRNDKMHTEPFSIEMISDKQTRPPFDEMYYAMRNALQVCLQNTEKEYELRNYWF